MDVSMVASVEGVPIWVYLGTPVGTALLAAGGLYVLFRDVIRDRHTQSEVARQRAKRLDATIDAVLGVEADPTIGRRAEAALRDVVEEQGRTLRRVEETIGPLNGKNVRDLIAEVKASADRAGRAAADIDERLGDRIDVEDRRHAEMLARLRATEGDR